MSNNEEWMGAAAAQDYVSRTDRQLRRWAEAGRVRTRKRGGRVEYAKADLDAIRETLEPDPEPRSRQQIVPAGELMGYVRELQEQLQQSAAREGYLRAQLEQRLALTDERALRDELTAERERRQAIEAERAAVEAQLQQARRGGRVWQVVAVAVAVLLVLSIVWFLLIR